MKIIVFSILAGDKNGEGYADLRRNLTDGLRELNVKSWEGFVDRYALAAAPSGASAAWQWVDAGGVRPALPGQIEVERNQVLRHLEGAPALPFGYSAAVLVAWLPPLWFLLMNPRVDAVRKHFGMPGI